MSNDLRQSYASYFVSDKDKYNSTSSTGDIFDRIINLKLYAINEDGKEDTYVIRSDYEVYYPKLEKAVLSDSLVTTALTQAYVRKCQFKPSIKVQYKRVSLTDAVEIDIFLSNFFMLDSSGKMIMSFNNSTYRLHKVEIAMGYFSQFKSAYQTDSEMPSISSLAEFDKDTLAGNGISLLTMSDVQYVQTDKLPPDMTIHIHGFVSASYTAKATVPDSFPDTYDSLINSKAVLESSSFSKATSSAKDSYLGQIFFKYVTRRFIKLGLDKDSKLKSKISSAKDEKTGYYSESIAKKYGITVYITEGVKDYSEKLVENFPKDKDKNTVYPDYNVSLEETVMSQIDSIFNVLSLSDFAKVQLNEDDSIIVCLKTELNDIDSLVQNVSELKSLYKETVNAKYWNNTIPAVYNITTDALCTIVCPFYCFINPFEKVIFKSRYALGGIVAYYANFNATEDTFYILWQNVSFATVENINETTLVCTGSK